MDPLQDNDRLMVKVTEVCATSIRTRLLESMLLDGHLRENDSRHPGWSVRTVRASERDASRVYMYECK